MKLVKSRGSISLVTLVSLMIIVSLLPLLLMSFKYIAKASVDFENIEDELVLYKLRKIYLLSYEQDIKDDEIEFIYDNKTWNLCFINDKLLLKPGSQIFLSNVDDLEFASNDLILYIHYSKKGKEYEKVLGEAKGLYFADFLDTTHSESESIGSELLFNQSES